MIAQCSRGVICRQEKLKDGYKLVIFHARVDSNADNVPLLNLHFNGVRKARTHAKLGYVRPIHLKRSLSVRSLAAGKVASLRLPRNDMNVYVGGGIVFSLRVVVRFISPTIVKVRSDSSKSSTSGSFLYLTDDELRTWMSLRQQETRRLSEGLTNDKRYGIHAFVNKLNCSQRIKDILVVST